MAEKMKVWVSKYALTGGITEHMAEIDDGDACPGEPFASFTRFRIGKDAHLTREGAVEAAEAMRNRKATSVRKQLAKLDAMKF